MTTIEITPCQLEDVALLQQISIETYSDTFGKQNTEKNMTDYLTAAYELTKLEAELTTPDSYFYFLKKDNQIAGYLKLNINNAQTEEMKNALEVERIYIRKDFKRQGLGKTFIELAETIAKRLQKETIWLGVWEYNFNALEFYKKMGFKHFSQHSFFMGDDEQTDLLLKKSI